MKMTDNEIQFKAFLATWKVLRQGQSERYFRIEKCIRRRRNGKLIAIIAEEQKKSNLKMLITALSATSDDRLERAKRINSANFRELRRIMAE